LRHNVAAPHLGRKGVQLQTNDVLDTKRQVVHGNAVFQAIRGIIDAVKPVAGEVQHSFPQSFARDGAGMQIPPT
jgi:hypothetical protein